MDPPPTPQRPLARLADRLQTGPLQAMLTLHERAAVLAATADADATHELEQLTELVRLAQLALDRFQVFTIELKVLVFELGERRKRDSP
jgi:hypothetical protein